MRRQCPVGSPQLLRQFDRYSLQPPLRLGDRARSHQLGKEWHYSRAVPCLLLRSLGLQQAKMAQERGRLLRSPERYVCHSAGEWRLTRGALFVVRAECASP